MTRSWTERRTGRRVWLRGALGAGALAVGWPKTAQALPHGPIKRDPRGILDLPDGFEYDVVERVGARMDDGFLVPGRPDAMGCFPLDQGRFALMRNHELAPGASTAPFTTSMGPPAESYSKHGVGGVSRVVFDAASGRRLSSNLVLAGTTLNCAGGLSPWGWLSCEETTETGHGYVFLCDPKASRVAPPQRIAAYGRFRHEAAVVHPRTFVAYMTEDQMDSALYRFVPASRDQPFKGRFQALVVTGRPRADTAPARSGDRFEVTWVDVPNPVPADDSVRYQAREGGAARFARGEGMWLAGDAIYFTATAGGPIGRGQVFRLDTRTSELEVLYASEDPHLLDMPDNLTVGPTGIVYLAEDGPGGNLLRILAPSGELMPLARNAASIGEFAGVCFSPDQRTMFVNLQDDGLTLAVRGPFETVLTALSAPSKSGQTSEGFPPFPPGVAGLGTGAGLVAVAAMVARSRKRE
ncbi:MAG: DUF839 domain-containing protein [Myxococcales bacterium]|nr:DUF839 domain-containing protein [Myxococcales bacterium]